MQLTVLGCWAPYPRPEEACSGYLLKNDSTALMLEAGHGSFARLTKNIDYKQLDGVVITHYHPDHYADIHCLRHAIEGARRDGRMENKIKLFIPPEPSEIYRELSGFTKAFDVINIAELPTSELPAALPGGLIPGSPLSSVPAKTAQLNELTLYFIPILHVLPGYAVLISQGKQSLFFTSDTAPTPEISRAAVNVDLLLCEASGLNKDADKMAGLHMTSGQAGELARQVRAARLVLTHFWPEYNVDDLLAEAGEAFGSAVFAAAQDKIFTLP
ncbi:MBL fold metallo-hydrolase [Sporotomaculum syntrophicum]|nr:MBL fold metallo-hydrolase [Sporotomaculum syntrophicum]